MVRASPAPPAGPTTSSLSAWGASDEWRSRMQINQRPSRETHASAYRTPDATEGSGVIARGAWSPSWRYSRWSAKFEKNTVDPLREPRGALREPQELWTA